MRGVLSGFSPLSLSPALWLDASDPNTLYDATTGGNLVAAGGAIARWEDKSGNARHATQGTLSSRPLRALSVQNGRDGVVFDGSNDFMSGASCGFTTIATFFAVAIRYERSTSDSIGVLFQARNGSTDYFTPYNVYDGTYRWRFYNGLNLDYKTGSQPPFLNQATLLYAKNNNGTAEIGCNGDIVLGNAGNLDSNNYPYYLSYWSNGNQYISWKICEIIVFPIDLSTSNRKRVERYLGAKWGITVA